MARRILTALVLAVLAVAWPAAADGASSEPPETASADPGPGGQDGNATASNETAEPASNETAESHPSQDASSSSTMAATPLDESGALATAIAIAPPEGDAELPEQQSCRPYSITAPGENTYLTEAIQFDPDGCLRSFIRRAIGWPPADPKPIGIHLALL